MIIVVGGYLSWEEFVSQIDVDDRAKFKWIGSIQDAQLWVGVPDHVICLYPRLDDAQDIKKALLDKTMPIEVVAAREAGILIDQSVYLKKMSNDTCAGIDDARVARDMLR